MREADIPPGFYYDMPNDRLLPIPERFANLYLAPTGVQIASGIFVDRDAAAQHAGWSATLGFRRIALVRIQAWRIG